MVLAEILEELLVIAALNANEWPIASAAFMCQLIPLQGEIRTGLRNVLSENLSKTFLTKQCQT